MLDNMQITNVKNFIQQNTFHRKIDAVEEGLFAKTLNQGDEYVKCGMSDNNFTYVKYVVGKFSFFEYKEGTMAVSNDFSGCIFVKFIYNNQWYIAHLANDGACKWTEHWRYLAAQNEIQKYFLFYPAGGRNELFDNIPGGYDCRKKYSAVGVIDANNNCHGLFYDNIGLTNDHYGYYHWSPFNENTCSGLGAIPKSLQNHMERQIWKKNCSCCTIL